MHMISVYTVYTSHSRQTRATTGQMVSIPCGIQYTCMVHCGAYRICREVPARRITLKDREEQSISRFSEEFQKVYFTRSAQLYPDEHDS